MALRLSLPLFSPPTGLFCAAHLRRTGARVPADRVIDDEAFCRSCFHGKPISPVQKLQRSGPDSNRLPADPPPVDRPVPDADQAKSPIRERNMLNDGIPASHRLTPLEVKLLNALQQVLLDETMMLAAIYRYRIPVTGRKKKAATARRGGRSRRTWQIPLQPTPIVRQAPPRPRESTA
jgi:hypothetical protein